MFSFPNLMMLLGSTVVMMVIVRSIFPNERTTVLELMLSILIGVVMATNGYGVIV